MITMMMNRLVGLLRRDAQVLVPVLLNTPRRTQEDVAGVAPGSTGSRVVGIIPPEIHGGLMVDFGKEQVIRPG